MTLLIGSVLENDAARLRTVAERCLAAGADAVELRLDRLNTLDDTTIRWAGRLPAGRWIATCRSAAEGGSSEAPVAERAARLATLARRGARIDFEYADWQQSPEVRQQLQEATGIAPGRLILSHHDFSGWPADPDGILKRIATEPGAVPKLAWMPRSICDNFAALRLVRSSRPPAVVLCMGEAGLMSRVLARKFGAFGTYCAATEGEPTAPGQATLATMLDVYRWRQIGPGTRFFGVIGWPVAHSMGPRLHGAAFERTGIDGVYLPLAVDPSDRVLEDFLDGCLANEWLDAAGFSVTAPHKARVLAYLGDRVDALARRIGAVNTLVVSEGQYHGYNTDYSGALDALTAGLGCERRDLRGVAVDLLGAGGAARAVVAGLREYGADVTISNIIPEDADRLAEEFRCGVTPWDHRMRGSGSVLVNCTSIGMLPDVDASPVPADALGRYEAVFDVVYNPIETRLLRDAAASGCRTIGGVEMFVYQAAEQLRLWTGLEPEVGLMRDLVVGELTRAQHG